MEGPISCCSFILFVIFGNCTVRLPQSENVAQNMHVAMHLCSSSVGKTWHGQALIKCAAIRFVSLRLPSLKGILGSHTVCISNLDLTGEVFFWILHLKGTVLIFKPCTKAIFSMSNFHFILEGMCLSVHLSVYAEVNLRGSSE